MRGLGKILIISLVFQSALLLDGCSGYRDIDKRLFVMGIGIDRTENSEPSYQVTLNSSIPSTESRAVKFNSIIFSEETRDIPEAIPKIQAQTDKQLDFSYTKSIIFGENMDSEDLSFAMDWLIRRRDIQKTAFVAIGKPNAKAILAQNTVLQNSASKFLTQVFSSSGSESNYITPEYLFDLYRRTGELGLDPFLPLIERGPYGYKVEQVALLGKGRRFNTKLILSPAETQIFNLVNQNQSHLNFRVKTTLNDFVIQVHHVKHHYSIIAKPKGKPELQLHIKIHGVIEATRRLIAPKHLPAYERLASKTLQSRVVHLLQKLQANTVDPFGFGLQYRATHWDNETKWQKWQRLYPKLSLKVKVDTVISSTGLIK